MLIPYKTFLCLRVCLSLRAEERPRSHSSGHMNVMCLPSPQLLVENDQWTNTVKDLVGLSGCCYSGLDNSCRNCTGADPLGTDMSDLLVRGKERCGRLLTALACLPPSEHNSRLHQTMKPNIVCQYNASLNSEWIPMVDVPGAGGNLSLVHSYPWFQSASKYIFSWN